MTQEGKGILDIMKQAHKMRKELQRIQEELAKRTIEATSGGGMVTVVVNGSQELLSIKIERDIVDPEDLEMLENLILAAVNEGIKKSQDMLKEEMAKITGGINIPGLTM
jgi:DNA-binding YbaB/EbfC family protein